MCSYISGTILCILCTHSCFVVPINLLQRQQTTADTAALVKNMLTDQQQMQREQKEVGGMYNVLISQDDTMSLVM